MGFFMKIELNYSLIVCYVLELERFVCDHATTIENDSLKALLCTRIAFPYTMHVPEVN